MNQIPNKPKNTEYLCGRCRAKLKYELDDGRGRLHLYCPSCNKVICWTVEL